MKDEARLKMKDERLKTKQDKRLKKKYAEKSIMEYHIIVNEDKVEVKEKGQKYAIDLHERLLQFAVDIIKFLFLLPYLKELDVFRNQLSKAATSIGANYEESQAGTYNEFKNRIQICLR